MPEAIVGVRLQSLGTEETKADLESVRAAMLGVDAATLRQAKDTRALARDAQALNQQGQLSTRIWLAQHPAINNLTKAMSGFASAARSALAVTSAFNLAVLAFNSTNSTLTELQAELREVDRQLKITTDPEQVRELNDEAGILKSKIKELNEQMTAQQLSNWVGFGAALTIIGEQIIKLVPIIATRLVPALATMAPAMWAALGPIGLLIAALGVVALTLALIIIPAKDLEGMLASVFGPDVAAGIIAAKDAIIGVMTVLSPLVLGFRIWKYVLEDLLPWITGTFAPGVGNAFIFLANTALEISDMVVRVIRDMVNSVVDGINAMIRAVNVAASALGLPKLKVIGRVEMSGMGGGARIPYIESGGGAGNASASGSYRRAYGAPAVAGMMSSSGGGMGGSTVNINVAGSIQSERDFFKIMDKYLKQDYRDRGMSGFV